MDNCWMFDGKSRYQLSFSIFTSRHTQSHAVQFHLDARKNQIRIVCSLLHLVCWFFAVVVVFFVATVDVYCLFRFVSFFLVILFAPPPPVSYYSFAYCSSHCCKLRMNMSESMTSTSYGFVNGFVW